MEWSYSIDSVQFIFQYFGNESIGMDKHCFISNVIKGINWIQKYKN